MSDEAKQELLQSRRYTAYFVSRKLGKAYAAKVIDDWRAARDRLETALLLLDDGAPASALDLVAEAANYLTSVTNVVRKAGLVTSNQGSGDKK